MGFHCIHNPFLVSLPSPQPMFFHAPPCPNDHTFLDPEQYQPFTGHFLDQETGQASVQIEVPSANTKAKTPLAEDDSSGSLFKETVAEIPVSECLYVSLASQTSMTSQPTQARFNHTGTVSQGVVSDGKSSSPIRYPSLGDQLFNNQSSSFVNGHRANSAQPPPRPILPPPTSCSPPPIPPSPPLAIQTSPTHHRVMKGAAGTVQFAGMSSAISARQSEGDGTRGGKDAGWKATRKRKFFSFGSSKDEPDSVTPIQTEDRKNLLDEISSMGNAILKRTNRPRSPGGTPVKPATSNQPSQTSADTDMLQRALMTKFRSLHSTPLNQSRFHRGDYSSSLDFSNAWSDLNASIMYEDPDISSSPFGATPNQSAANESNKMHSAHNGSTAV